MQEAEFLALPLWKYAFCRCGRLDRLSIKRDIYDYINGRPYHTPLYLCGGCHWSMDCEYRAWERYFKKEFGVDTWGLDDYLTTQQFSAYVMEGFKRHKARKEIQEREEKRKRMDTALIASKEFETTEEVAAWANGLIGTRVDIDRGTTTEHAYTQHAYIDKILQFHIIPTSRYASMKAIVLVQVLEPIGG